MLFWCLDIRWNTPSRVWCITFPCLDIRWNTPSRVSYNTSLCSEIRWNTCVYSWVLCIVFVSLCKGNSRSNFESLPSHLSKYEDSIPLADRNRNNILALDRMNNYLYRAWCHIVNFSNCNLFPTKNLGVLERTHFNVYVRSRSTGIWKCWIWGEGKTGQPGEKPLGARKTTNNKLNPQMASTPGFQPGPHWWEASALTTAPPLLPHIGIEDIILLSCERGGGGNSFFIPFPTPLECSSPLVLSP